MTHIEQRIGTASEWTAANPVLHDGEVGWERTGEIRRFKVGDGVTPWTALPYGVTVVVNKADVGLGNVDNTSDAEKPVSNPQRDALARKADLASPAFTGNPTAPTPPTGDNDLSLATTAFVQQELSSRAPLVSPQFTGNPTAPLAPKDDNDTSLASTAFVTRAVHETVHPRANIRAVAQQTISNNSVTDVVFGMSDPANTAHQVSIRADGKGFGVQRAGWYVVNFNPAWSTAAVSSHPNSTYITINGTAVSAVAAAGIYWEGSLAVGALVGFQVYQQSGANQLLISGTTGFASVATIRRVGP